MGSIEPHNLKNGEKSYEARWRAPDGRSESLRFPSLGEAKEFLKELAVQEKRGVYVDPSAGKKRFEDYAETWVKGRRHKRTGRPLGTRTAAEYRGLLRRCINPTFGKAELTQIRPLAVAVWHSDLEGTTEPAKAYRLFRAIMNTAVKQELIARNPVDIEGAGAEDAPERVPPKIELIWEMVTAMSTEERRRYRALVFLWMGTGVRISEAARLERRDIDPERLVVKVARQAKSRAGLREIAVPLVVMAELVDHLALYTGPEETAWVFVGPRGGQLKGNNFYADIWKPARDEIGATKEQMTPHLLRHYSATLASEGASIAELQARFGWSSVSAAARYLHASRERDVVIAERINEAMGTPPRRLYSVDGGAA